MSQARKVRWSYSSGERGRNRVRAFEHHVTGMIFLEFYDSGKRERVALSHRDQAAAKNKADELAAALGNAVTPLKADPGLQALFDNYLREVTPQKSAGKQAHDHRTVKLLLQFFGSRKASLLNRRDWDGYIAWRHKLGDTRSGKTRGQPIGSRIIEYDLRFLQAVLNWAVTARDDSDRFLLDRNPLKGMPWPKEDQPRRPTVTRDEYRKLLKAAPSVDSRCELALLIAHETGHRIGAIIQLRWADVDFDNEVIRWRGDQDKIGFEHSSPLVEPLLTALQAAQSSTASEWVIPCPTDATKPCSRHLLRDWWQRMEDVAGLERQAGRGWHSLRRKFATELKDVGLRDLCELGGWKDPLTIVKCYQQPDQNRMREALATRGVVRLKQKRKRHRQSTPRPKQSKTKRPA